MTEEKYRALMAERNSDDKTKATPKDTAFQYINAAKHCAAQFIDSPATMAVLNCLASYTDYRDGTSFCGYESITHYTGYTSSATISTALDRLEAMGILHRRRRMNTSTKYTLSLSRMKYLRKPQLKAFQQQVLNRINKCIGGEDFDGTDSDAALTHNIVLCMKEPDDVIWEVLNWYADLWEDGHKDEGTPETVCGSIDAWGHWIIFMRGLREEKNGKLTYSSGYPEIRRSYFAWKGVEEPSLDWPTQNNKDALMDYWDHWNGTFCGYCHKLHIGGCNPERVKYVQSLKKCKNKECKKTIFLEDGEHICKPGKKAIAAGVTASLSGGN